LQRPFKGLLKALERLSKTLKGLGKAFQRPFKGLGKAFERPFVCLGSS